MSIFIGSICSTTANAFCKWLLDLTEAEAGRLFFWRACLFLEDEDGDAKLSRQIVPFYFSFMFPPYAK